MCGTGLVTDENSHGDTSYFGRTCRRREGSPSVLRLVAVVLGRGGITRVAVAPHAYALAGCGRRAVTASARAGGLLATRGKPGKGESRWCQCRAVSAVIPEFAVRSACHGSAAVSMTEKALVVKDAGCRIVTTAPEIVGVGGFGSAGIRSTISAANAAPRSRPLR